MYPYLYMPTCLPIRVIFSKISYGWNMSKLYLTFDNMHNAPSHINPPTTTVVRDILRGKNAVKSGIHRNKAFKRHYNFGGFCTPHFTYYHALYYNVTSGSLPTFLSDYLRIRCVSCLQFTFIGVLFRKLGPCEIV